MICGTNSKTRREICERLRKPSDFETEIVKGTSNGQHVSNFVSAFDGSGQYSIDAFLARRSEYEVIGKKALAATLLLHERDSEGRFSQTDCWYRRLFNALFENCEVVEDFSNNKISILTYNYDRSLENYLFSCLKYSFGATDGECEQQIEKLNIIHLHGHLGLLDWQGGERPYNIFKYDGSVSSRAIHRAKTDDERSRERELTILHIAVEKAMESIKVIHEIDVEEQPQFNLAHEILNEAHYVYFLGFGYDQLNLDRLNYLRWSNLKSCKGTAYLLDLQTRDRLKRQDIRPHRYLVLSEKKCYDFLHSDIIFR